MTKRIGNKDEAQHRSKEEKKAIKQAIAKTKYRNQVKNRPSGDIFLPAA
jgi:hypothetical protein